MAMQLKDGLRPDHSSRIAFVGAGGKTTAMFSLARQLPSLVVCLNTAHLAVEQAKMADHHVIAVGEATILEAFERIRSGVVLFTGAVTDRGRLAGVSPDAVEIIKSCADDYDLPVLVEADGSRLLPLKAPAEHEPPIPAWTNHVVVMFGLSVLGKPLTAENVFRPEIFAELTGAHPGSPVTIEQILGYLEHPKGGLKNIPSDTRRTVFANQLDVCSRPQDDLFSSLGTLHRSYHSTLAGSLHEPSGQVWWRHERVAGIVLAAGGSTRMGQVKQLLRWQGKPLVRQVAETAIRAGLDPVVVVTGSAAREVEAALEGLPVQLVFNREWESGQASSIRAGVMNLPAEIGGAVFLLSDMPQIPPSLIQAELEIHRREFVSIICPRVDSRRGNPVLFDRQTFPALLELTGDSGGRILFDRFPIRWLAWDDPEILRDIDTPADYQEFSQGSENAE